MTGQPRKRGPRGDITAQHLLSAAEHVLQAKGLAALSLRAVAREAGVTPNVLYTYFDDMADLRNKLGDEFVARLNLTLLKITPAADGLRHFLLHVLDVFSRSPGHVELLASQRIAGNNALALNEALLDFFIDSVGHSPAHAAGITRLVTEWVHGRLLLSPSNTGSAGFHTALARLDTNRYPRTVATQALPDDESALETLITAITTT